MRVETTRHQSSTQPCHHNVIPIVKHIVIRYSNPTPSEDKPTPEEDSHQSFRWLPFNESLLNYLSITDNPTMQVGYHWRGHQFWNK